MPKITVSSSLPHLPIFTVSASDTKVKCFHGIWGVFFKTISVAERLLINEPAQTCILLNVNPANECSDYVLRQDAKEHGFDL